MSIVSLSVEHFRNLRAVQLTPAAGINVIYGANAAGKTSLLEAIYFLGRVRSFRAARAELLIAHGAEALTVRADVDVGDQCVRAAVQRGGDFTRVRINGDDVRSLSSLARYFPVQVINTESQRLLQDGPKVRRSFINWGVFHVEQEYSGQWRRFERALKQRNAALRLGDERQAKAWEPELVATSAAISVQREVFIDRLLGESRPLLDLWLPESELSFSYRPGWPADRELGEAYEDGRARELEVGHTLYGPHRADLAVRSAGVDAQHRLSRGQQKLLAIALLIAESHLISGLGRERGILLLDDLPAELDIQRREEVLSVLQQGKAQVFVTCTERDSVPIASESAHWFHVEHGEYREVV